MEATLIRSIEDIGCEASADLGDVLDCIERVLCNPHDRRHDSAVKVLRSLLETAGDHGLRISHMLARYGRPEVVSAPTDPYRALTNPDDPKWAKEVQRLSGLTHERAQIAELSKALTDTFENRLRGCDEEARRVFLIAHGKLFADTVRSLGPHMSPAHRVTLTEWIAECGMIELEELLREGLEKRTPDLWERVHSRATELQQSQQTSEESIRKAGEAAGLADRARSWRARFERVLRVIREYDFGGEPAFPWSPRETVGEGSGITLEQVEKAYSGLDEWGGAFDRYAWQDAALDLSRRALTRLCAHGGRAPRQALECTVALRGQWPSTLGPLPDHAAWDQSEWQLRALLATMVSEWLKDLCARFRTRRDLLAEFDAHPDLPYLPEVASGEQQRFREDLQRLEAIGNDLQAWWENGDTDVLYDGRLERLRGELDGMRDAWGRSPGYQGYCDRLRELQVELDLLDSAKRQLRNGDAAGALETLKGCRSPAAAGLAAGARQSGHDQRIRAALKHGDLAAIACADLERASPDVRTRYEAIERGRAFLQGLRQRARAAPQSPDFRSLAAWTVTLLGEQPPPNAILADNDSTELEVLRNDLREQLFRRADQLEDLRAQVRLYPLIDAKALARLEGQAGSLADGLNLPGVSELDWFEANRLLDTLLPIQKCLRVHRLCSDGDWKGAEAELTDPVVETHLDRHQRRELAAMVRASRLLDERAPDSSWLAVYRELGDVLMAHEQSRNRYLQLLRRASDGYEVEHRAILARWMPKESYLSGLLACFADPSAAEEIEGPPGVEDEPLFKRLLEHLVQSPQNYYPVRRLWQLLPEPARQRIWLEQESPVDRLTGLLREEQERIVTLLSDPQEEIAGLKDRLDALVRTGRVDKRTVKTVDVAAAVERKVRDFEHQDPWDEALQPLLEQTRRDLGHLPLAVLEARGWRQAAEHRIDGIRAWEDLSSAWHDFSTRFNKRFVGFHPDAEPWNDFQALLKHWIESVDRALPQLHWDLPGAAQSRRWTALIEDWSRSPEGLLWRAERGSAPADPVALRDAYHQVSVQISEVAMLHARLLEGIARPLLAQLRDLRPLCRPVDEIKRQLTNPEVAPKIGAAYQRFVAERDQQ